MNLELFYSISAVVIICSITLATFFFYRANTTRNLRTHYRLNHISFMMTLITGVVLLLQAFFLILSLV